MADNHSTGKNRPNKTLKDTQALSPPCQDCVNITKTIDTTALAQSGFSDLGALFLAIRSACDKHTNPYQLAGIGQYLADEWINTLDGELETLAAARRTQQ
ncbi:MAG: hypothetical protein PVI97_08330 [Candidatus Thiodiazotropha sp.]|jgi:hypothetical protein